MLQAGPLAIALLQPLHGLLAVRHLRQSWLLSVGLGLRQARRRVGGGIQPLITQEGLGQPAQQAQTEAQASAHTEEMP